MLRLRGRGFGERDTVVMAALSDPADPADLPGLAARAVGRGAGIVALGGPGAPAAVAAVRAAHPDLPIAVETSDPDVAEAACAAGADLVDDPGGADGARLAAVAARHGAALVCAPEAVAGALAAGVRADGVLVADRAAEPGPATRAAARLAAAGHPVLVRLPGPPLAGAALTATALSAWLGARVFRTTEVAAARQALDMVASIAGHRPPAVAVRGLR